MKKVKNQEIQVCILDYLSQTPDEGQEYNEIINACWRKFGRDARGTTSRNIRHQFDELLKKRFIEKERHGHFMLPQRKKVGVERWRSRDYIVRLIEEFGLLEKDTKKDFPFLADLIKKTEFKAPEFLKYRFEHSNENYLEWLKKQLKNKKKKTSLKEEILLRSCDDALTASAQLKSDLRILDSKMTIEHLREGGKGNFLEKKQDQEWRQYAELFVWPEAMIEYLYEIRAKYHDMPDKMLYHLNQTIIYLENTVGTSRNTKRGSFGTYLKGHEAETDEYIEKAWSEGLKYKEVIRVLEETLQLVFSPEDTKA